jgi:hypothetical protein
VGVEAVGQEGVTNLAWLKANITAFMHFPRS